MDASGGFFPFLPFAWPLLLRPHGSDKD
jgi:hypothetical protein